MGHNEECCSTNHQCADHHCNAGSCHQDPCHSQEECCDSAKSLLQLADHAWMEVLKEKIKDLIRKNDTRLDEIAQVVADANRAKWHNKIAQEKNCCDYKKKIEDVMKGGKCCDSQNNKK